MQPGRVLSDRYELVERLGSGGMAEVFRAHDRVLERDVAVKLLLRDRAFDDQFVRRFRREARSAASLNHPNVVSIHDTGTDDTGTDAETHFIVMSLIDGPTLETVIAERAPFPIDEVVDIAIEVCRALEAAHAAGLVHRDIKPGNVMFDASGEVKVTDFGIALVAAATRLTRNADVFGSASYLAPEQATGDDVDERADLYALGCVTYEMLTGRPPFTGAEPIGVVYQHLHGELEPPLAHRDDIPAGLDAIVTRMLARDREHRYASASGVREELERLRAGGPTAAAVAVGVGPGVTATQRLEPPDDTVAISPARAASPGTEAEPPPAPGGDAGGRPRPSWVTGLAVVAALVLLAALLAATVLRPDPAGDPGPLAGTPVDEPSPSLSPTPSPTPTTPSAPSLEDAVGALYGTLVEGQQQGELSDKAADEVRKKSEEALDKFREGDVDEALKKLDEARREVDELSREGEIEPDRADAVLAAIDAVEQAMRREAPPPDEDGGGEDDGGDNEGEGNEGRGNGGGGGDGRGDDD